MKQRFARVIAFTTTLMCAGALAQPAQAGDLVPPKILTRTPGGVNISDGAFTETVTDLQIGTLSLERFHLGAPLTYEMSGGRDADDMFFGKHVSHNFDIYVAPNMTQAHDGFGRMYKPIVHMGMSTSGMHEEDFTGTNPITAGNEQAMREVLVKENGDYRFTDDAGTVYQFSHNIQAVGAGSGTQRVTSITYADGRLITFGYNASAQLKIVRDNQGFAIVFDYTAAGDVSAACGYNAAVTVVSASSTCAAATLKTVYTYTTSNNVVRLTGVTDVNGGTTTYVYSPNHLCITPPGYTICKIDNTYNGYDQVVQQTMADGAVWQLQVPPAPPRDTEVPIEATHSAHVTDPLQHSSEYVFTGSTLNQITDASGHATDYHFVGVRDFSEQNPLPNQGTELSEVDYFEGNRYVSAHDGYLRPTAETWYAKPNSGAADVTVSRGYPDCDVVSPACFRPTWTRDGRHNQTDITYNSVGQVLTETGPAVNGVRPQTRYEYAQRTAWISNGAGGYVAAGPPISLRVASSICRSSAATGNPAAPCATAVDEVRTTYDYGSDNVANNLLVRGQAVMANGSTLRSCWSYDRNGHRISETGAGAQLAQCPL